jgi:hypothetical protein
MIELVNSCLKNKSVQGGEGREGEGLGREREKGRRKGGEMALVYLG